MKTNRLESLFGRKNKDILSIYFTAGFPQLNSVKDIICNLSEAGVDLIEVGVPFSDPMADGPIIQHSSSIAIKNGMTLRRLFNDIAEVRKQISSIPLILMGYLNPFMQLGFRHLFELCAESGIDGLIIPDLPFEDYLDDFKLLCEEFNIPIIMLITPETSDERIRLIDDNCDGFIYMVSSASTTGTKEYFSEIQIDYFRHVDTLRLKHPRLIGFGISNPTTLKEAWKYSSGAIIGSLFIKCLDRDPDIKSAVRDLMITIGL